MSKSKVRARRKGRAASIGTLKTPWDGFSPLGKYLTDTLAEQYARDGIFFPHPEIGVRARALVQIAANRCVSFTRFHFEKRPQLESETTRLFSDLYIIDHLITRNLNIGSDAGSPLVRPRLVVDFLKQYAEVPQRIARLKEALCTAKSEIVEFLDSYDQQRSDTRNLDPLSHEFIDTMFWEVWADLRFKRQPNHRDLVVADLLGADKKYFLPFVRFLAAAWRDLAFPIEDHRGHSREPLEKWFSDRVRKRLPAWNLAPFDSGSNSVDT